jgi:hypothetical protein
MPIPVIDMRNMKVPWSVRGFMRKIVLLAACASLLGACNAHSDTGTISGHLFAVGGPAPGAPRPLPGTVFFTGRFGVHVDVASDGTFSVILPQGTYTLAGRSPLYGDGKYVCQATAEVTVRSGGVTSADVLCQEK